MRRHGSDVIESRRRSTAGQDRQPVVRFSPSPADENEFGRLIGRDGGLVVLSGDRMRRVSGPEWVEEPRSGTDGVPAVPGWQHSAGFRLRVFSAVLYIAGLSLLILGAVGALLWGPLLWCMAAGLVAITVALATRGGRL